MISATSSAVQEHDYIDTFMSHRRMRITSSKQNTAISLTTLTKLLHHRPSLPTQLARNLNIPSRVFIRGGWQLPTMPAAPPSILHADVYTRTIGRAQLWLSRRYHSLPQGAVLQGHFPRSNRQSKCQWKEYNTFRIQ